MLCKDEKAVTLAAFLEELKKAVPNLSPRFFMLDNCGAEINAVIEVFPLTRILLCIFHVIQVSHLCNDDKDTSILDQFE